MVTDSIHKHNDFATTILKLKNRISILRFRDQKLKDWDCGQSKISKMCITVTTVSLMPFSVGSAGRVVSGSAGSWPLVSAKTPKNIILLIFISFFYKNWSARKLESLFLFETVSHILSKYDSKMNLFSEAI